MVIFLTTTCPLFFLLFRCQCIFKDFFFFFSAAYNFVFKATCVDLLFLKTSKAKEIQGFFLLICLFFPPLFIFRDVTHKTFFLLGILILNPLLHD